MIELIKHLYCVVHDKIAMRGLNKYLAEQDAIGNVINVYVSNDDQFVFTTSNNKGDK